MKYNKGFSFHFEVALLVKVSKQDWGMVSMIALQSRHKPTNRYATSAEVLQRLKTNAAVHHQIYDADLFENLVSVFLSTGENAFL